VLDSLFKPRSVLVIGVSPSPHNPARHIVGNLITFRYPGAIHLLGTKPGFVAGHPIHTSFDEVPDGIDLAILLTPARTVADLLDQCGHKGIRHAIVQSGGFKELGDEGASPEDRLIEVAQRHGIRFVGPNCLGTVAPSEGMATFFVPFTNFFQVGGTCVAAQSGGVGATYLYHLASENVGVHRFVSMGNKMSLDETDYVQAFAADPQTDVIALYLESVVRGRAFFDAVAASDKPVLVQKSGRTSLGQRAAFSHTAALSGDDAVLSAAIRQAGGLRVESTTGMMALIKGFNMPPMKGRRVAILSRSGGHAVIAADCAADHGFELPDFPPEFIEAIGSSWANSVIKRGNPLDLGDLFDFDTYARLVEGAAAMDGFDAVVMVHEYFAAFEGEQARKLVPKAQEIAQKYGKPVAMVLFSDEKEIAHLKRRNRYPFFTQVEDVFAALRASHAHAQHRSRGRVKVGKAPDAVTAAAGKVASLAASGRKALLLEGFEVLQAAGVRVPSWGIARSVDDVPEKLDGPVAAKAVSAKAVHKSDAGGVVLGIADPARLRDVVADFAGRFGPFGEGEGVLIQGMAAPATEIIVGGRNDPSWGPVVMVGIGGVLVEALKDTSLRLGPITPEQAIDAIRELRGAALLDSVRGRPPADLDALGRLVSTVSFLLAAAPQIREIDLNPCLVYPEGKGVTVVDVRIRL
jgi:acetyltransferase